MRSASHISSRQMLQLLHTEAASASPGQPGSSVRVPVLVLELTVVLARSDRELERLDMTELETVRSSSTWSPQDVEVVLLVTSSLSSITDITSRQ